MGIKRFYIDRLVYVYVACQNVLDVFYTAGHCFAIMLQQDRIRGCRPSLSQPEPLATGVCGLRTGIVDADVACELGHLSRPSLTGLPRTGTTHRAWLTISD